MEAALTLASAPSVILFIPPAYSGVTLATYMNYVSDVYTVAAAASRPVCVFDLSALCYN